jgi:hypothetical protein
VDEKLWAGVELKLQHAEFHFDMMGRSIQLPEQTWITVVVQASGAIIGTGWQRSFYAYLDAFLSTARSVPEIIQCCFGVDLGHPEMRQWFKTRPADEQVRRHEFKKKFKSHYDSFRALPLGTARHISEHRSGVAPARVTISGLFGVTYIGNPAEGVPLSETRQIDDHNLAFLAKANPIHPKWQNFDIEGQPLFPTCGDYLNHARALIDEGRRIGSKFMALRAYHFRRPKLIASPRCARSGCCEPNPRPCDSRGSSFVCSQPAPASQVQ